MTDVKPGYKLTDVGVIPEDWNLTPLGKLVHSVEYGSAAKSGTKGTIPVLRMGNLQDGKIDWKDLVYTSDVAEINKYMLRAGDVLFNRTNTIDLVGKTSIYEGDHPAIFAGYLIRINLVPKLLDSRFLNYILNTQFSHQYGAKVLSVAVGQANINGQKLKTYPIPLPPTKAEQEAIAAALGNADALIESLEQLVAKKRQIKCGAMQQLLTGRKRLPGFSGEWKTKRFDELFTGLRNASNSRSELGSHGDVAYVHYGDIHTHPTAFLNPAALRTYVPRYKVRTVPRLADGDLLMVDASEDTTAIGKAVEVFGLNGTEAVAGLHTMALRGSNNYLANGFKGYIQYLPNVRAALVRLATGVSVYGITKSGVKMIEVTIPNPAEQTAIAAVLSDMDADIAAIETKLAKVRLVKQGMMQELLTGRRRLR